MRTDRTRLYLATTKLDVDFGIACFNGMSADYSTKAARDEDMEGLPRCFWYVADDFAAFTDAHGAGPRSEAIEFWWLRRTARVTN